MSTLIECISNKSLQNLMAISNKIVKGEEERRAGKKGGKK